jgi:hypothetical protein
MKRIDIPYTLLLGVFLAIISIVNVYHFAATKQPGNAVIATVSAIASGIIIGTATTRTRLLQNPPDKPHKK